MEYVMLGFIIGEIIQLIVINYFIKIWGDTNVKD